MAKGIAHRLASSAYVLLPLTSLCFAGNHVVGRAVAGHVPPVGLAFVRWCLAAAILLPIAWPHLKRDWPAIRSSWMMLLFLTALSGGLFSTMQYVGLVYTTALNTALLNSTVPVTIALACFVLFGDRLGWWQVGGILVSLAGVLAIIAKGSLDTLLALEFNIGDIIILANMTLWSIYSAYLRFKPAMHWLSFAAILAVVSLISNAPFVVAEHLWSAQLQADWPTALAVLYVAIFPSIVAFACWNRGVELIGANRAGVFLHLIPLFGAGLAISLLGEPIGWHHAAGLVLILTGVWLAGRKT
jgi:drug/metabolite transporter (DMT)-like permease